MARPDTETVASRLKNQKSRQELNQLARDHYGIADPVGYRRQEELIAAMIEADPEQAERDAGFATEPQEVAGDVETPDEGENTPDAETTPESDAEAPEGDERRELEDRAVALGATNATEVGTDSLRLMVEELERQQNDGETGTDDEPEPEELPEGIVLIVGTGTGNRVAFWERHRDHPNGEVFLRGGQTGQAALTADVQRAVKRGRVRLVDGK